MQEPGHLDRMKSILAAAQAKEAKKAQEEAERVGREQAAKGAERAAVEQEFTAATGELQRLGDDLAQAESLAGDMEKIKEVSADDHEAFKTVLAGLRSETEAARARLEALSTRKTALDAEAPAVAAAPSPVEAQGTTEHTPLDRELARELTTEEQAELGTLREQVEQINTRPEDTKKIFDIRQIEQELQTLANARLLEIAIDRLVKKHLGREESDKLSDRETRDVLEKRYGMPDALDSTLTNFYQDKSGQPQESKRANPAIAALGEYRNDLRQLAAKNKTSNPETAALQEEQAKKVEALAEKIRTAVQRISQVEVVSRELLRSVRETSTTIRQAENRERSKLYETLRAETGDDREARKSDAKTKYMKELEDLDKELYKKIGLK